VANLNLKFTKVVYNKLKVTITYKVNNLSGNEIIKIGRSGFRYNYIVWI